MWEVSDDAGGAKLRVRLPARLSVDVAEGASSEIAARLREASQSMPIVVDLYDVEWFDVSAPLVAIRNLTPVVDRVEALDLIVRNRALRTAAISAAHVLGLPFRIREAREEPDEEP